MYYGLQRVQGAVDRAQWLEAALHVHWSWPEWDRGPPGDAPGSHFHGYVQAQRVYSFICVYTISDDMFIWHVCLCVTGYRLSPQAMNCIIKRFSSQGKITFDDYVACCVKLRTLTGEWTVLITCPLSLWLLYMWLFGNSLSLYVCYRFVPKAGPSWTGNGHISIRWCKSFKSLTFYFQILFLVVSTYCKWPLLKC